MCSHVNSSPRAPTHKGNSLCKAESANAHPINREKQISERHELIDTSIFNQKFIEGLCFLIDSILSVGKEK